MSIFPDHVVWQAPVFLDHQAHARMHWQLAAAELPLVLVTHARILLLFGAQHQ